MQRELNLEDRKRRLEEHSIIRAIQTTRDLDEASIAYRNIETVIREQSDLVDPLVRLEPLAVVKG